MSTSSPSSRGGPHAPFFPFARYTSIVGVHSSLILFSALFLPQSLLIDVLPTAVLHILPQRLVAPQTPAFNKGLDHPQSRFLENLTASPAVTLAWTSMGLILLQVWWAGWLREWQKEYQQSLLGGPLVEEASEKEAKRLARTGGQGLFAPEALQGTQDAVATSFLGAIVFYGLLVLGGAPVLSHMHQTALFSIVLSLLTVYVPAYVLGPPLDLKSLISIPKSSTTTRSSFGTGALTRRLAWTRIFAEFRSFSPIETALLHPAVGALGGAWIGMIPLALDWERPWQQWPLPPVWGAIIGNVLGAMSACATNSFYHLVETGKMKVPEARDAKVDVGKGKAKGSGNGNGKTQTKERKTVQIQATGQESKQFEGNAAVEEMRKSVQAVLSGMKASPEDKDEEEDEKKNGDDGEEEADETMVGTATDTTGKKKKTRRRRRGGKGPAVEDSES